MAKLVELDYSKHPDCPRISDKATYIFPENGGYVPTDALIIVFDPIFYLHPSLEAKEKNPFLSKTCLKCSEMRVGGFIRTRANKYQMKIVAINKCTKYGGLRAGVEKGTSFSVEELERIVEERGKNLMNDSMQPFE